MSASHGPRLWGNKEAPLEKLELLSIVRQSCDAGRRCLSRVVSDGGSVRLLQTVPEARDRGLSHSAREEDLAVAQIVDTVL